MGHARYAPHVLHYIHLWLGFSRVYVGSFRVYVGCRVYTSTLAPEGSQNEGCVISTDVGAWPKCWLQSWANHNEPGYIMKLWHIHLQIQHGEIPSLKRELIHNGQSEGLKKLKERPSFSPWWQQTCSIVRAAGVWMGKNTLLAGASHLVNGFHIPYITGVSPIFLTWVSPMHYPLVI